MNTPQESFNLIVSSYQELIQNFLPPILGQSQMAILKPHLETIQQAIKPIEQEKPPCRKTRNKAQGATQG